MAENAAGTMITPETFELAAAQNDTIIIADQRVETLGALTTVNTPALALAQSSAPAAAPPARRAPKPLDVRVVASQFVDVPVSGDARSLARYSGRIDGYIEVNSSVYGGPSNLTIKQRPEYTWGRDSNGQVGLIPGNTGRCRQPSFPPRPEGFSRTSNSGRAGGIPPVPPAFFRPIPRKTVAQTNALQNHRSACPRPFGWSRHPCRRE